MSTIIKIAFHLPTKKLIHIDNASNGLACNCECLKCNERLEAVQGEVRTKHFRHHVNLNCEGSRESALHELGKQILVDNYEISIPKHDIIIYSNPIAEKRLENKKPDVSAIYDGQPIFFEIYVSHAVDIDKAKFFIEKKYRSIEIDLSDCFTSSFIEIKKFVLEEVGNKKIFYWEDEKLIETKKLDLKQTHKNWIGLLIGSVLALFLFCRLMVFSSKKRKWL